MFKATQLVAATLDFGFIMLKSRIGFKSPFQLFSDHYKAFATTRPLIYFILQTDLSQTPQFPLEDQVLLSRPLHQHGYKANDTRHRCESRHWLCHSASYCTPLARCNLHLSMPLRKIRSGSYFRNAGKWGQIKARCSRTRYHK